MMDVLNKLMIRFRSGQPCLNYSGSFPFRPWDYFISAFHRSVHQSVPLVLGRFARVVFLDAGSAVGGFSWSSLSFFCISLFHDICLSRRFSSLLGRQISICHAHKSKYSHEEKANRRILHARQQEKINWGLLTEVSALS